MYFSPSSSSSFLLQSLIPEIKPPPGGQEAVVDLHADDSRISEDEAERHLEEPAHEKALKICRTVTQVGACGGERQLPIGPRGEAALGREIRQATKRHARQTTDLFNSHRFYCTLISHRFQGGEQPILP